ncbi:MAG: hypothetical protein NT107_02505 [Planctomycetota bacterium]|nr:hypothetical protein [Planctomycetota bacterium]
MRDEKTANPFVPMRSAVMCGDVRRDAVLCGAMQRDVQQPVFARITTRVCRATKGPRTPSSQCAVRCCAVMCGAMQRIVQQPVIDALLLRRHVDRVQDGGVLLGPFRASLPSSARRIGIGCIVCLAAATRIAI